MLETFCYLCDVELRSSSDMLCDDCMTLIAVNINACSCCGIQLHSQYPNSSSSIQHGEIQCGKCQSNPPLFTKLISATQYKAPIDTLITRFKFKKEIHLTEFFCDLLVKQIDKAHDCDRYKIPDVLIPVPLHKQRLVERGFNQSNLLAERLAKHYTICSYSDVVFRQKATKPQTLVEPKYRLKNVKACFDTNQVNKEKIGGLHIAIVDDVVTSGSTVNELAKVLFENGAKRVDVWSIARAQFA